MNYMTKVAEMLGVEMGERFKITSREGTYWIDKNRGLVNDEEPFGLPCLFDTVLKGGLQIVKIPWKPKYKEEYYFVNKRGDILQTMWGITAFDIALYAFDNCFRTEAEAKAHKDEVLAKMKEVIGG